MSFLVAYLFFNDGIQTVIVSASLYGKEELGFGDSQLIVTILLVQFVAFLGALLFGRLAAVMGAKKAILLSLGLWTLVIAVAFFLPAKQFALWLCLGVGIVLVQTGQLQVAELVAFFAMATVLRWPMESIGFLFSFLLDARTATDRIFEVFDEDNTIVDQDEPLFQLVPSTWVRGVRHPAPPRRQTAGVCSGSPDA